MEQQLFIAVPYTLVASNKQARMGAENVEYESVDSAKSGVRGASMKRIPLVQRQDRLQAGLFRSTVCLEHGTINIIFVQKYQLIVPTKTYHI